MPKVQKFLAKEGGIHKRRFARSRVPSRKGRKAPIPLDADLYRLRHKIENLFARLKDWRRIATPYDRCPINYLSACALAATVIYWL